MSDVIIFWEDPPAPEDLFPIIGDNGQRYKNTLGHYHAGCCPNCRCLASPVIFIDDLKFPVRVYTHGMIKTMTKKDFFALYNAKVRELKAENAQKKQLSQKVEIKKTPEELAKEKRAKEEKDFLKAQNAKVDKLISEINSCTQNINALQKSLLSCTDEKVVEITEKLNYYVNLIEEHKKELRKIRDSIIISNSPVVGDALVTDAKIIEICQVVAKALKEKIDNFEDFINDFLNSIDKDRYSYLTKKELNELRKTAGNITKEEKYQITSRDNFEHGYIGTTHSQDINKSMRNNNTEALDDDDKQTIETLKNVIGKNFSHRNIIVNRYVDNWIDQSFLKENFTAPKYYPEINGEDIVETINTEYKDKIIANNCFISASYNKNNLVNYRCVKLKILIPKGTNIYLTENEEESEIILHPDVKFQIVSSQLIYIEHKEKIEITVKVVD